MDKKEYFDALWLKLTLLLQSRKFWTLVIALLTTVSAYATGELSVWQALIAAVSALSVYSGAVALEDGLSRRA